MVRYLLYTGARKSEAPRLKWEHAHGDRAAVGHVDDRFMTRRQIHDRLIARRTQTSGKNGIYWRTGLTLVTIVFLYRRKRSAVSGPVGNWLGGILRA